MSIKTSITVLLLVVLQATQVIAQKDPVLFTLNDANVYNSEFSRIYEKNLNIVNDESQKDLENYLDLYINYRLKLQQAYELKMDTVPTYVAEYNKYKNQLIEPYLKDDNKEKDLVKEAYQRMLKEVKTNHILVRLKENASPQDTLRAYNRIMDARKLIVKGSPFDSIARLRSEDPSAKMNGGNLGYFTVFQMVYPFETKAYTTPIGEVSMPFKTRFGYHIIKVDDIRDARGEVQVAHIMLKGDTEENITKINNIKKELSEGGDFAALAKSYSTDLATSMKGGILPKFTANKMVKSFSDVAFSLQTKGEISEPFKTRFGWHIVKLIDKFPVGSFEQMKPEIDKSVKRGQREKLIGRSVIDRLLSEYSIITNEEVLSLYSNMEWSESKKDLDESKTILSVEGKEIPAKNFTNFSNSHKKLDVNTAFQQFKEQEVMSYYKEQLPNLYPDLDQTLREYREGLLLFDLMQKKIWEKAERDSLGIAEYFENNRGKYQWKDRVKATIITCDKEENALKVIELLNNNIANDSIKKLVSDKGIFDLKDGAYEKDNSLFPEKFAFKKGISEIYTIDKQYRVINVKEFLPAQPKELNETRGRVISDYQDQVEKQWIKKLHKQYPVSINKKALKKLKKKYN